MATKFDSNALMKMLDFAYDKAINGVPGLDSAEEMAMNYLNGEGDLRDKVNRLIRFQNTKAFSSGFISGLGGVITLPVAIPANITSVMYVQVRMTAAIAHMGGYDLSDDRVKTLVYAFLCGNAIKDVLKEAGIVIGKKLTEAMIRKLSVEVLKSINQKVGFRLVTKFGEKGIITLGKGVPIVGGVIGGTCDGIATNLIGNVARDTFIPYGTA